MRLDVSDLFEQLYDVAQFIRLKYDFARDANELSPAGDDWQRLCNALSDRLFLPACAERAFSLTHCHMPAVEVKSRIIAERSPENGSKILYLRYGGPYFFGGPGFVADDSIVLAHPRVKLTLWLGKLPPREKDVIPPSYPTHLDLPIRYFARQYIGFHSRAPTTIYYELHGDWLLRQIDQREGTLECRRFAGEWRRIDDLVEIPAEVFERVWAENP